jgi:hypothetical protein
MTSSHPVYENAQESTGVAIRVATNIWRLLSIPPHRRFFDDKKAGCRAGPWEVQARRLRARVVVFRVPTDGRGMSGPAGGAWARFRGIIENRYCNRYLSPR